MQLLCWGQWVEIRIGIVLCVNMCVHGKCNLSLLSILFCTMHIATHCFFVFVFIISIFVLLIATLLFLFYLFLL